MSGEDKIKVVWVCHFVNASFKKFFNDSSLQTSAPWISELLVLFENSDIIDLHVVSPNYYINKNVNVKIKNINYYFYQHKPFFLKSKLISKIYVKLNLNIPYINKIISRRMYRIIEDIKPDIIHLHGAENPVYSIIGNNPKILKKYPILLTIQGFISKSTHKNKQIDYRIKLEKSILKKISNVGVRTIEMDDYIKDINFNSKAYWHNYPINKPKVDAINVHKKYDCVFFARITKDKGVEDLLKAVSLINEKKDPIKVLILGSCSNSYKTFLLQLIRDLKIESSINFHGFVESQEELYNLASTASLSILPTYHDIIPGTIIESMYMKIPVISYGVGGIPEINEEQENILLSEKGNILNLADNIINLLNDTDYQKRLAEGAYNYALKRFDNSVIPSDIISIYNKVISNKKDDKTL